MLDPYEAKFLSLYIVELRKEVEEPPENKG